MSSFDLEVTESQAAAVEKFGRFIVKLRLTVPAILTLSLNLTVLPFLVQLKLLLVELYIPPRLNPLQERRTDVVPG